ncbi:MAG: DUF2203 domain-containing protein [Phycisphaeraceae bacterium]
MTNDHASAIKAGPSPQPGKKYFTVDEANRALPYVSRIVADVIATYGEVAELRHQLEADDEANARSADAEREYQGRMDRLSSLVDELQGAGVELKDFEKGLIDFPAVFEGREVLLCWHQGETTVSHWHELDAGFAGRQSVELLKESADESSAS